MPQTSQFERERAKRLYAATISSISGLTLQTEYKHIGDGPIAECWYRWAEMIHEKWLEEVDKTMRQMLKPEKRVIQ